MIDDVTLYTYEVLFERTDGSMGVFTTRAEDDNHAEERFFHRYPDHKIFNVINYGEIS